MAHPAAPFLAPLSPHRLPAVSPGAWDTRDAMAQPGHNSPAKELQQPPPVLADLLAPGMSPSGAGEERPPAQLLLEDGPESGLGTQHLDATHTCVNATLRESGTLSSSGTAPTPHTARSRAQPLLPYLLAPLHPDLDDGPEAGHVLQQDHSAVRGQDGHLQGGTETSARQPACKRLPQPSSCHSHLPEGTSQGLAPGPHLHGAQQGPARLCHGDSPR